MRIATYEIIGTVEWCVENILSTISEDAYSKCTWLKCYINFKGESFVFYLARKTRSRCSLRINFFDIPWVFLSLPFNLLISLQLSYSQYFHTLGTSKSSTVPPTLSIEETKETVEMEIRGLNITAVLFQLLLKAPQLLKIERYAQRLTHRVCMGDEG